MPIVTIGINLYAAGLKLTLANILQIVTLHPFHIFFLLHPLLFAVVFGAMGTVRYNKEQKIKELNKIKSDFLSMISHELRTPLTTIQGYTTFLLTEKAGPLNTAQKEYLKINEEAADFLNHLIEELLGLAKIESGEFKVNLENIDIKKTVEKAVASLMLSACNKNITLENKFSQNLPPVRADEKRILQVIINLTENAIKFNNPGGSIKLSVDKLTRVRKIIFCVEDTGIGIPQDKLTKIFDKFFQIDSSGKRKYGGCGLGLAISKNIIELHGGKIWAESKIGAGSKFFFELPYNYPPTVDKYTFAGSQSR